MPGAVGAAYSVWHEYLDNERVVDAENDAMQGSYLGCHFSNDEVEQYFNKIGVNYVFLDNERLFRKIARLLSQENVVGWFQGRMEFGPRALGARSILGDPRSAKCNL